MEQPVVIEVSGVIMLMLLARSCNLLDPFHIAATRTVHQCMLVGTSSVCSSRTFPHSGISEVRCHIRLLQDGVGRKEESIISVNKLVLKGSEGELVPPVMGSILLALMSDMCSLP